MLTLKKFLKLSQSTINNKIQFIGISNIAKICGIPVATISGGGNGGVDEWVDDYYGLDYWTPDDGWADWDGTKYTPHVDEPYEIDLSVTEGATWNQNFQPHAVKFTIENDPGDLIVSLYMDSVLVDGMYTRPNLLNSVSFISGEELSLYDMFKYYNLVWESDAIKIGGFYIWSDSSATGWAITKIEFITRSDPEAVYGPEQDPFTVWLKNAGHSLLNDDAIKYRNGNEIELWYDDQLPYWFCWIPASELPTSYNIVTSITNIEMYFPTIGTGEWVTTFNTDYWYAFNDSVWTGEKWQCTDLSSNPLPSLHARTEWLDTLIANNTYPTKFKVTMELNAIGWDKPFDSVITYSGTGFIPESRLAVRSSGGVSKIYTFGDSSFNNTFKSIDPTSGEVTASISNSLTGRYNPGMLNSVGYDYSTVYMFGGETATGVLNDFNSFNGSTWSTLSTGPGGRSGPAMCVLEGKIYIFSGVGDSSTMLTDLWEYSSGSWTQKTSISDWDYAQGTSIVGYHSYFNDYLFVFGGYNGSEYTNTIYRYDLDTNTWTQRTSGATPRSGHFAFMIDNFMYIVGGTTASGIANDVWEYNILTDTWANKLSYDFDLGEKVAGVYFYDKFLLMAKNDTSGDYEDVVTLYNIDK